MPNKLQMFFFKNDTVSKKEVVLMLQNDNSTQYVYFFKVPVSNAGGRSFYWPRKKTVFLAYRRRTPLGSFRKER